MELNREFPKEEKQMTKKYFLMCSRYLVITDIYIETTLKCHVASIRMATIKKKDYKC